jgi:glycosylphosphatidylinositol transamidase
MPVCYPARPQKLIILCHPVYRTNTFPLVHAGFFHAFMNVIALTPLLERFEAEYGTLTTLALFLGRTYTFVFVGYYKDLVGVLTYLAALSTIPALMYTFVEKAIGLNTTILGARYGHDILE